MKFLNLKLRRDIFHNWTQFFSVFLMAFLSVLIFVGLQGAWHGLEVSLNEFASDSKLADSWVQSAGFTQDDLEAIEQIEGIEEINDKNRVQVTVSESVQEQYLYLDTYDHQITQPVIDEGASFSTTDAGLWINREYAKANNLSVGDTLDIIFNEQIVPLAVVGIVQSADRIYYTGTAEFIAPNHQDYGYGYISEATLHEKLGYQGPTNLVEITGSNSKIRQELETILGDRFLSYFDRHTLVDVSDAFDRVGQIRNLSFLFSFIFILLAILAMYTTIRRLIETQTKEIAVLKALGFSNYQIGLHYASFGLLIGGGGAVLGAIVSPLMSWFVLTTQQGMFSLPNWKIAYSLSSVVVFLSVVLICVLAALFASREATVGLPAIFLRGNTDKRGRKIFLERFPRIWQHLRYEQRWAIRDGAINRARMLMGIIGVAGGMMLLIAGIGMPQSINQLVDKAYNTDFTYTSRLQVNNYSEAKDAFENGQWIQIQQARYSPDDSYNRLLIVLSEGNYVNMKTADGKTVEDNGAYVTQGFAERAGLEVGDSLEIIPSLDTNEYVLPINGIIMSETNQGVYITASTWETLGGRFQPTTVLVGDEYTTETIENNDNISSYISISSQEENAYDFVNSLMSIFLMIIGFAILLVVVVLYNLGSLNFVERTRDYATLRVLGFHKNELRNITMIENIATTLIGWLLGIPLGIWFLNEYVRTFSTIRLEYTSYVSWQNLLIASLIVWICSMTTTFLISQRIQKLDMVEALKGIE